MQCLILAGGLGTRMKTITGDKPKALLPVGKETFISVQLRWLKLLGVDQAILALATGSEQIQKEIENSNSKRNFPKVIYKLDGPKLLGTGGAVRNAADILENEFLVTYGDSFVFINLKDFHQKHVAAGLPLTMSLFKNEDEGDKSNVFYSKGQIVTYSKKHRTSDMKHIDYGLSLINRDYFLSHTATGVFDLADFMAETVEKGRAHGYVAKEIFREVGSPEGYSGFLEVMNGCSYDLHLLAKQKHLIDF